MRLPICADEGADNAGWNCEWIEDCSSETPTGAVVPTQPDCALSSPGAGQYQQADGQYQDDADPCATAQGDESDPNRSAQPAPGDCTERPAGSAATDTPSAGAPPAAAVEPETQPVEQPTTPPEQSSTTPAAGRPHGASGGRAKTPLTPPDGETSADREGWSQLRGRASATVAVSVSPPPVAGRTETVQPQRAVRTSASVPVPQSPAGASYRPHEFRVALAPPLADLSQARASASRAAPSVDRASLLFWAMFIAGVAALGLSTAGALRASGPALMVELSARVRSKGLSRPATRRRAAKHGSANGIRYRD